MVPHGALVKPETWRVASETGRLVFVSQTSGRPLTHERDERQVEVMQMMAVSPMLLNELERSTARLLTHAKANPHLRRHDERQIDRNHAVLALACVSPGQLRELLSATRQLTLWREAA